MFLTIKTQQNQYSRLSKNGVEHEYKRKKTVAVLRCDACDKQFERDLKHMDKKRLSNNFFHCCGSCDAKRFAQRTKEVISVVNDIAPEHLEIKTKNNSILVKKN